jgi:hypothetical protein
LKRYPFWLHCVTPSNKVQTVSLLESLRHAKQQVQAISLLASLRHAKQESSSDIASGVTASRQARKFKQYPFWRHCATPSKKVQAI